MTEAELRLLIHEAIAEAIAPPPRRALVLFTGGLLGFEDAIAGLRLLIADGVQLDYRQTPSAEKVLDQSLIASLGMREVSNRLVAEHQMLIAPTLTANIAAKVSHGVADCLGSNLFSEFIMANRLVVASRTAICPDGAAKQAWFPHMPSAYADLLRGNLSTLASFGVRLADSRALYRTTIAAFERAEAAHRAAVAEAFGSSIEVLRGRLAGATPGSAPAATAPQAAPTALSRPSVVGCTQTLISQQVIQQLDTGTELRISATAKVTAMATDLASTRSIRITREV